PSKPYAYVNNELDSTVTTYGFESGALRPRQIITTLPPSYTGNNTTSEIAVSPSGRHLYVSNRGHDSIDAFAIDDGPAVLRPVALEWGPAALRLMGRGDDGAA